MTRSGLNRFAILTAFSTFLLIIAGALVTSTGSGLSVPDWPLSFGKFFPKMEGGVFFEHGHRMIAGTVATFTIVLTIWLWKKEERRWLCWVGTGALSAVVLQALLGGLTVLFKLPRPVSVMHAVLAQTFFCLTVAIALFTSPFWMEGKMESGITENIKSVFALAGMTAAVIYVQLILGAMVRHGASPLFLNLHFTVAGLVFLSALALSIRLIGNLARQENLFSLGIFIIIVLAIQIFLGGTIFLAMAGKILFFTSWIRTAVVTAHVACGALLLAASVLTALISHRFKMTLETSPSNEQKSFGVTKNAFSTETGWNNAVPVRVRNP